MVVMKVQARGDKLTQDLKYSGSISFVSGQQKQLNKRMKEVHTDSKNRDGNKTKQSHLVYR